MMKKIFSLLTGVLFGFALSRAGTTNYDIMFEMFLFKDTHLMGVMAAAILTVFLGVSIFKKLKLRAIDGSLMNFPVKKDEPNLIYGAIFFGIGWALTGTCPGTALAQLGEGKLTALITISGMFIGALMHGIFQGNKALPK